MYYFFIEIMYYYDNDKYENPATSINEMRLNNTYSFNFILEDDNYILKDITK